MAESLKNREAQTIVNAWTKLNARVELAGLQPKKYMLDNECSNDLRSAFEKHNISFQLERPHLH